MNGPSTTAARVTPKPPPSGPAPPAPAVAPPVPPSNTQLTPGKHGTPPVTNGTHPPPTKTNKKKAEPPPVDPAQMYESLKNRIAVLEEDAVQGVEEEKKFVEEAQKSVKGLDDSAIQEKYVQLFQELKRMERDFAKEKQKLVKDKDAAKGQLTKANQTKTKMENLARELQKDNKRLREDSKRLAQSVEEAQDEIQQMKNDVAKRAEKAKLQDIKYREQPDIVVKVLCKYRAELFFKISRKTKLSRLFNAWTERMEGLNAMLTAKQGDKNSAATPVQPNGVVKSDAASLHTLNSSTSSTMQFMFTHGGRTLESDMTPEEAGIDDGDEIYAVEMMDLTEGPDLDVFDDSIEIRRQKLKKNWTDNPREAKRAMEEIFDSVVRERLKDVLKQYELRERHFECVVRSKELEVLLSRARAAEQKQLAEQEKTRADKFEHESVKLQRELDDVSAGQNMLIEKLMACCQEPNQDRMQRLFATLREELEKRPKIGDGPVG
ncbi:hypothetical protein PUNSTDRAFT_129592 [Punctularia strigosozonata HHB-11173 SS5]|uniref:uncharacterized protein n=1 Tax=Punctularia strigosozonata (strain HHB-11173) TaxID=741275 RepID=UPI00044162F4|nr:uncharacterized protein PUNSTDRAFT_129592 [Punctularia strigosozonata HHB-11173 SS5]EIN13927.1 hypothetical protein PUNSTDRAFT_129592 [Punctularia strigosozonata HHB-11173 SS5]